MNILTKYAIVIIGFLLLCKISPLGAGVAVLTCIIRCLFKNRVFSHTAALLLHEFIAWVFRGFKPRRVRMEVYERRPSRLLPPRH